MLALSRNIIYIYAWNNFWKGQKTWAEVVSGMGNLVAGSEGGGGSQSLCLLELGVPSHLPSSCAKGRGRDEGGKVNSGYRTLPALSQ